MCLTQTSNCFCAFKARYNQNRVLKRRLILNELTKQLKKPHRNVNMRKTIPVVMKKEIKFSDNKI